MKKLLSILLAVLMVVSIVPLSAFAGEWFGYCGANGENVKFILSGNAYPADYVVTLQGEGNTKDYAYFDASIFYSYSNSVRKITIEEGITSIGDYLFPGFSSLYYVSLPKTLTKIGKGSFMGLNSIVCSTLKSIVIPCGVEIIGEKAFQNQSGLSSVVLSKNLKEIGLRAFDGCSVLDLVHYLGTEKDWNSMTIGNYNTKIINATRHYCTPLDIIDATCSESGVINTWYCNECDEVFEGGETLEATGHTYEEVVTEPTCTAQGYTTYTCACGDSYVEPGEAATGHSHEETVVPPTCEGQGYTQYVCACGDSYMDNFEDALDHDMADATCTAPATCKREGCNHTEGDALGHEYGDWVVDKEATTSEEGLQTKTCSRCGDVVSEPIPVKKASKGCTGSVGGSLVGILGLCLSAVVIKRKHN